MKEPDVQVNENHIKFVATGVGARGTQLYEFELELGANIVPVVWKLLFFLYCITAHYSSFNLILLSS